MENIVKNDEASSPRARAERLRRVRNLANLTRKQMCEGSGLNINTYTGHESAKYGGLTSWAAEKVVNRLAREGVSCTVNWLLHGIGQSPSVITDYNAIKDGLTALSIQPEKTAEKKAEEVLITQELLLFRQHYKNILDFTVTDDGMLPHYQIGDTIAGIRYAGKHILDLAGLDCIVQTRPGELLFRVLRESSTKAGTYTLTCSNPMTAVSVPILYEVEVIHAAAVIWHRRKRRLSF